MDHSPFMSDREYSAVIIEDIDIHNEKPLRTILNVVQEKAGMPGQLRLSILNTDQWQGTTRRLLGHKYRGAAPHIHFFVDPTERNHFLVSPSGVLGMAEGDASIISEAVYGALAAIGAPLQPLWRAGVHDYLAQAVAKETKLRFQDSYHPRETRLIVDLVQVLRAEHGNKFEVDQWFQSLKRKPGSVFNALARSRFAAFWIQEALKNPDLALEFEGLTTSEQRRDKFIKLLTDPALTWNDRPALLTQNLLQRLSQNDS